MVWIYSSLGLLQRAMSVWNSPGVRVEPTLEPLQCSGRLHEWHPLRLGDEMTVIYEE